MKQNGYSELTDQELLAEAKKVKSAAIFNALLIGALIGIVIYSAVKNTWGFFTLIPLYFIYKLVDRPKNTEELDEILKERNLR